MMIHYSPMIYMDVIIHLRPNPAASLTNSCSVSDPGVFTKHM